MVVQKKRHPDRRLIKHKNLLFDNVGIQQQGVNYWEPYYTVVKCMSVRDMLILSTLKELHTKTVELFLAYTQDEAKKEYFMYLIIEFGFEGDHPSEWVIIMDKNKYGLKDEGIAWFKKIKEGLKSIFFVQLQVDPCVWNR